MRTSIGLRVVKGLWDVFRALEQDKKSVARFFNAVCVFQTKAATDSRGSLPPIPRESCH